jgi:putative flavoprotein involved in K+ transport
MNSWFFDVIVIGAGQAGLSMGYYLEKLGLTFIIFEKGKIGDTWRNQRWDSFKLNTPNKVNSLSGKEKAFSDEEGFCSSSDFVSYLEHYSKDHQLPVIEDSRVLSVENSPLHGIFSTYVSEKGSVRNYQSRQIVIASGAQNIKSIPSISKDIPAGIYQLHTCDYRNASLLPEGAVLVVGSAQSGVQIAEDLLENGRKVFISTSQVSRFPRRFRGKDIVDWLILSGFFDYRTADITDSKTLTMKQPQISNMGPRGHTLSLQGLARDGAVILGKTENASDDTVFLKPDAADNIRFADDSSIRIKEMIDEFIRKSGIYAPAAEDDPDDEPDEDARYASTCTSLNLKKNKIGTIIWATGFKGDFSYLKLPVFDSSGAIEHHDGVSNLDGLFFLGNPWLRKRKSGIILGINEDAEFIADKISSYYNA